MATTNGNLHNQDQYKPSEGYTSATESIPEQTTSGGTNHDLSKDEVGWYFVEQYYNTLSKSPEKLHVWHTSVAYIERMDPEANLACIDSFSMASGPSSYMVRRLRLPTFLLDVTYVPLRTFPGIPFWGGFF